MVTVAIVADRRRDFVALLEKRLLQRNPHRNPFAPGTGSRRPESSGREAILQGVAIALDRIRTGRQAQSGILMSSAACGKTALLNDMRGTPKVKFLRVGVGVCVIWICGRREGLDFDCRFFRGALAFRFPAKACPSSHDLPPLFQCGSPAVCTFCLGGDGMGKSRLNILP